MSIQIQVNSNRAVNNEFLLAHGHLNNNLNVNNKNQNNNANIQLQILQSKLWKYQPGVTSELCASLSSDEIQ
eukprot:Pgem_evm1s16010